MKRNLKNAVKLLSIVMIALLFVLPAVHAAETDADAASETVTVVHLIVKIDKETRTITLKNEAGQEQELVCGPEVRNFDQLKRGDFVVTEYYQGIAIALEPKGSGLKERIDAIDVERAKKGDKPGMKITKSTYIEAVIAAVDADQRIVTIEGAKGALVLKVDEDVDLSKVKTGEEIEALFIQSLKISVKPAPEVSGMVDMKIKAVALGVGFEWGEGTLTMFDGSTHDFKVKGLTLVDVGITGIEAKGNVYHLVEAKDLEGTYIAAEAGAALGGGGSALAMKNSNGVVIQLLPSQQGVRLTLAGEGLNISLK